MEGRITTQDPEYPQKLLDLPSLPKVLYFAGQMSPDMFSRCLGVVGSRRLTGYGRKAIRTLVPDVARAGVTIVSGFMRGADEEAHRITLEAGGRTIAVLPCGVRKIYPAGQRWLYEDIIARGGLVLSEYPAITPTAPWTYPRRNRIVAALSDALLVVEAARDSGSLMTAGFALKYGRKVLAVPGPIFSRKSDGTLDLIRRGAEAVGTSAQILGVLQSQFQQRGRHEKHLEENSSCLGELSQLTVFERQLLELLTGRSATVSEVAEMLQRPVAEVCAVLTQLQTHQMVAEKGGRFHAH